MKADNQNIINNALQQNLAALYENLEKMSDLLETNFYQLNEALQKHHDIII